MFHALTKMPAPNKISSRKPAAAVYDRRPEAPPLPARIPKVGMISLGCAKNLVDAEIMLGSVLERGMQITSDATEADELMTAEEYDEFVQKESGK